MTKVFYIWPPSEPACRALWLRVIHQALADLVTTSNATGNKKATLEAWRWLFLPNEDFLVVCGLANVNAQAIRKRAKEIKANPSLLGDYHV